MIFEFIGGVPHTDWFDNDSAIVKVERNPEIKKSIHDLFTRFQMHYDFKEVFCSPHAPNEKGVVESAVRYLRNKLFVPVPHFENLEDYNRLLLNRCKELMNRNHYKRKTTISELWLEDLNALCPLPSAPFDVSTIRRRKCNALGGVTTENNKYSYYISPAYAYKTIQLRQSYNEIELIDVYGRHIVTYPRIYGKPGQVCIHWEDYLPTIICLLYNKNVGSCKTKM